MKSEKKKYPQKYASSKSFLGNCKNIIKFWKNPKYIKNIEKLKNTSFLSTLF
jgi:hypothetical protein